ncbi:MAG: HD domain-containing protein [Rickettsiales bacterium]
MEDYTYSTINDAIHGVMALPSEHKEVLKKIIDSPNFQRLRHIKQLGLAELVYPTATHNRFSHSLGTAFIASKMIEILTHQIHDAKDAKKDEVLKYAIIGGLLHDIGHGPFSHAFEALLKTENNKDADNTITHTDWTLSFLKEYEDFLEHAGIDYKKLSELITSKEHLKADDNLNIAADIISSQLDADRMDYLLRDSHFCGVSYGKIDLDWILNHLTVIRETAYPPRLGIRKKATKAVEHFLFARKLMYQNISYHHKIRTIEILLVEFLRAICKELSKEPSNNPSNKKPKSNLVKFLTNVGGYNKTTNKDAFINENYSYYKTLTDYDIWTLIRDISRGDPSIIKDSNLDAFKLAKILYNRDLHKNFYFPATSLDAVEFIVKEVRDKLELKEWELFSIENKVCPYDASKDPILVRDDYDRIFRIQEYSDLLKSIGDKVEKEGILAISRALWDKHGAKMTKDFSKYIFFPQESDS